MFNLSKLLSGITPLGWLALFVCLIIWIAMTYFVGRYSEKKWGDRESGALIGFFIPGLLFSLCLYLI